jgi:hypothetical protein
MKNTDPQSGPIYYAHFWRWRTVLHLLPTTPRYTNLVHKTEFPALNRHFFTFSQGIRLSGNTYCAPVEMLSVEKKRYRHKSKVVPTNTIVVIPTITYRMVMVVQTETYPMVMVVPIETYRMVMVVPTKNYRMVMVIPTKAY